MNIARYTEVILDSIADGVFTVDKNWNIVSFNLAAENITGVPKTEAIGKKCCEVFKANICESGCALKMTLSNGIPVIDKKIYIITAQGDTKTITISTALLKDKKGNIYGGVETFRDVTEMEELKKELKASYTFHDIISKNHKMQAVFKLLPEIAKSESSVLIEGESGTGKELLARALHNLSSRKNKRFIAINCGALPDTLLESELFGYKAGAFTDAKKNKPGRFALAEGGTLFLDEIGDISLAMQVKLLRVLQEKVYEPLGSISSETSNIRIITATNKNLKDLIKQGVFRNDFYYRINVINLHLPPLRERKEDIPLLIEHFIQHFNKLMNKNIRDISQDALTALMDYEYPGNIRELQNIIEHAFVLCSSNILQLSHIPSYINHSHAHNERLADSFAEIERKFLLETLKRNNWNRKETAHYLGIHKSTLFRKLKGLSIILPKKDGRSNRQKVSDMQS